MKPYVRLNEAKDAWYTRQIGDYIVWVFQYTVRAGSMRQFLLPQQREVIIGRVRNATDD